MRTRDELAAGHIEPAGLNPTVASGGHLGGEIQPNHASAPIRRKAVRRAKRNVKSDGSVTDASVFVGQGGTDTHTIYANSGSGHISDDNQKSCAAPYDIAVPHGVDSLEGNDGSGIDQNPRAILAPPVNPATIAAIQSLHREHRAIQRAKGDMERRIKADERWFAVRRYRAEGIPLPDGKFPDVTPHDRAMVLATRQRFFIIRDHIEDGRKQCQKDLLKMVKTLPIMTWAAGVKGLGLPSVAAIIGEAGDLANYSNPGKLWKRMGLAVFDGKAQGKRTDAAEALRHGYNPHRRSEMHVVGDCLVRAGGPYADLYRARKAVEMERDGITKMHAHKRALRYIEKRLLREMWQVWRGTGTGVVSIPNLSPADELAGQLRAETQTSSASQDAGPEGSGTQSQPACVQPIPRKRVPRTSMSVSTINSLSGANA